LPSASKTAPNRGAIHPFDAKHGTDTGGYLGPEDLVTGRKNDALNYGYSAIAPSVFREACRRWRDTLAAVAGRVEAYSFVDVGAGKGRALFLASDLPFRKIIGIELNPDLARIAEQNIESWRRVARSKANIRVVAEDAMRFRWPRPPLLVYLYNPFDCSLVAQLAGKLAAASTAGSGLVDILYVNPTCRDALTATGMFSCQWTARIEMDDADQKADPYDTTTDLVAQFRRSR
jgi:SAM-dependent methyltransferase